MLLLFFTFTTSPLAAWQILCKIIVLQQKCEAAESHIHAFLMKKKVTIAVYMYVTIQIWESVFLFMYLFVYLFKKLIIVFSKNTLVGQMWP